MISVIIPTYNRARTITDSVMSVLNQTYTDIEVIVVDDCSTDNTMQVLREIHDPRLIVYQLQKNSGACVARNTGIDHASGQYIAFQDSDDIYLENKLQVQLGILKKMNADVCVTPIIRIGYDKKQENVYPKHRNGFLEHTELLQNSLVSTQMILGKREVFLNCKFDPIMPRMQDWDLVLRISKLYRIYFYDEPLCKVILQSDSLSQSYGKAIKAYERLLEKYEDDWNQNSDAKLNIMGYLAHACEKEGLPSAQIYREALKIKFKPKTFIKLLRSYFLSRKKKRL